MPEEYADASHQARASIRQGITGRRLDARRTLRACSICLRHVHVLIRHPTMPDLRSGSVVLFSQSARRGGFTRPKEGVSGPPLYVLFLSFPPKHPQLLLHHTNHCRYEEALRQDVFLTRKRVLFALMHRAEDGVCFLSLLLSSSYLWDGIAPDDFFSHSFPFYIFPPVSGIHHYELARRRGSERTAYAERCCCMWRPGERGRNRNHGSFYSFLLVFFLFLFQFFFFFLAGG